MFYTNFDKKLKNRVEKKKYIVDNNNLHIKFLRKKKGMKLNIIYKIDGRAFQLNNCIFKQLLKKKGKKVRIVLRKNYGNYFVIFSINLAYVRSFNLSFS